MAERESALLREAGMFVRFGMSGLPGFLIAILLNILLVEMAHWPKPVAYVPVVWMQMTAGFLFCRYFVFRHEIQRSFWVAYGQFALSMGLIRVADLGLYTCLVELAHVPYVAAQIMSTGIFIFVKFASAKAIFR